MSAQEETELLLRAALDVARKQFGRGQFMPFAATLGPKRDAKIFFTEDLEPSASREEIAEFWARELRETISQNEPCAACYCSVARVRVAEGSTAPILFIHVEHAEGGAQDFIYPCRKDETSGIVLAEPRNAAARREIFAN